MEEKTDNEAGLHTGRTHKDEISLVDLLLKIYRYRLTLLITIVVFLILGTLYMLSTKPTVQMTSSMRLATYAVNGQLAAVNSPQSIITMLEQIIIPRAISEIQGRHAVQPGSYTSPYNPAGSNIVVLTSYLNNLEQEDLHKELHGLIFAKVKEEQDAFIASLKASSPGETHIKIHAPTRLGAEPAMRVTPYPTPGYLIIMISAILGVIAFMLIVVAIELTKQVAAELKSNN